MKTWSRLLPPAATRRWIAITGVLAAGLSLFDVMPASGAPSDHAAGAARGAVAASTAPAEMHQLDFLLGNWTCTTTVSVPGAPVTVNTVKGRIYPVLGGAWYEWDAHRLPSSSLPTSLDSKWLFGGWNATSATFSTVYYDNGGNHGLETSVGSGWSDGHLKFTGTFTSPEGPFEYVDDFTTSGHSQFTDTIAISVADQVIPAGRGVCNRDK